MSDLLNQLKLGTDNVKIIKFPGSSKDVALRIISQRDYQDAAFATERLFKSEKIEVSMVTAEEYEVEKAIQLLYRALRDPQNLDEPISPSITEFRKLLTREELRLLKDEYLGFESECSPSPENLSAEEFDKVFVALKKNSVETIGSITNMSTLKKLLLTMVDQLSNLPTDSGSSSSRSTKQ
jgi:phage FluMu protein gp41